MLAIELSEEIEARLESLARVTGRTKAEHVRAAILDYLNDLEELPTKDEVQAIAEAEEDIRQGRTQSLEDFRREIGL